MKKLEKGGKIAIVAPSGYLDEGLLMKGAGVIESAGYEVEIMPHVSGHRVGVFSASDDMRSDDLCEAISREDIDAVICARGGYGAMRTLQKMPSDMLGKCRKWLVGFSDITVLHSELSRCGAASIHGPMIKHIATHGMEHDDVANMFRLMRGEQVCVEVSAHELTREGRAEGVMVGGNLSILYSLRGTPAEVDYRGKILFIEDLCEYRYHIDRMMQNLKYSGILEGLSGLVVGQFTDMKDGATPFGATAYEIISELVKEYDYPVLFGYPAGHDDSENQPLVMGRQCVIEGRNVIFG